MYSAEGTSGGVAMRHFYSVVKDLRLRLPLTKNGDTRCLGEVWLYRSVSEIPQGRSCARTVGPPAENIFHWVTDSLGTTWQTATFLFGIGCHVSFITPCVGSLLKFVPSCSVWREVVRAAFRVWAFFGLNCILLGAFSAVSRLVL